MSVLTMKNSGELITSINDDLADNNAGLISAEDVRHNMRDIAYSINHIVASGDTDVKYPFFNDVRFKHHGTPGIGGTVTGTGQAEFVGVVTASEFVGGGSGLTGLAIPAGFTELDAALFN